MRHINELARLIVEDEYGKVDPNLVIQQNPARFVDAVIVGVPLPELGNEQHQHGDEYESVTTIATWL